MLRRRLDRGSTEPTVNQVVDAHDLLAMRESVEQVSVHDDVLHYVGVLAGATRHHPQVAVGASPRAEIDLVQLARLARCFSARLRDPRRHQGTRHARCGAPDHVAAGDVGEEDTGLDIVEELCGGYRFHERAAARSRSAWPRSGTFSYLARIQH